MGALERQIVSILCTKQDEITITYVTSDRFVCLHLILLLLQVQAVSTTSWVSWLWLVCNSIRGRTGCRRALQCFCFWPAGNEEAPAHVHRKWEVVSFPMKKVHVGRDNKSRARYTQKVKVYCDCRMPGSFSESMVQCSKYKKWYRLDKCVHVADLTTKWCCSTC